jgi:two-component system, NarL family, sensor histidine kinase UhpB
MSPFGAARGSLRLRIMLIPTGILFIGMVAAVVGTLIAARARIGSETEAGVNMAGVLIGYALEEIATHRDPEGALLQLRRELAEVRHVRVQYRPNPTMPAEAMPGESETTTTPKWFLSLFEGPSIAATYPLIVAGVPRGNLVVLTWPADEVGEIWNSLVFLAGLLVVVAVAIIALLYSSARFALKPLQALETGLDRLEHGKFETLAVIEVAELRHIGERFNQLAASLARSEAQNHRLVDRLLSVQEAERKELARELHDEYGAALFGVRAATSCILEAAASSQDPSAGEIKERAQTIARLADAIQKQNYRILDRLQPVVLQQMGLAEALRHLAETWQATHLDCRCDLSLRKLSPAPDEDLSLACYRLVQECLTNIARHAQAKHAQIDVASDRDGATSGIRIIVEDDGIGLPQNFRTGFGLLGMQERVRKFAGHIEFGKSSRGGTRIAAFLPIATAVAALTDAATAKRAPAIDESARA